MNLVIKVFSINFAPSVNISIFKMSMLMKLKYILTQNVSQKQPENFLEKIYQELESEIYVGNISKIWIIKNKDDDDDDDDDDDNQIGIKIKSEENRIQINIGTKMGKDILSKIIFTYLKKNHVSDLIFIIKRDDINIKKIFYNHNREVFKQNNIENKYIEFIMRSFIIITERMHKNLNIYKYQLFE